VPGWGESSLLLEVEEVEAGDEVEEV